MTLRLVPAMEANLFTQRLAQACNFLLLCDSLANVLAHFLGLEISSNEDQLRSEARKGWKFEIQITFNFQYPLYLFRVTTLSGSVTNICVNGFKSTQNKSS